MDKRTFELIYGISDDFYENPKKVSSDLYKLTEIFSDLIWKKEYTELIEMKRTLDDELITKMIQDYSSYNLGKAHVLIELINLLKKPFEVESLIRSLNPNEKNILKLIKEKKELTPSHMRDELSFVSKQYLSNLLSNLRNQDLVNAYSVGKHRWYSLSLKGKDVLETILAHEDDDSHLFQIEDKKLKIEYLKEDTEKDIKQIIAYPKHVFFETENEINNTSENSGILDVGGNYLKFEENYRKRAKKSKNIPYSYSYSLSLGTEKEEKELHLI